MWTRWSDLNVIYNKLILSPLLHVNLIDDINNKQLYQQKMHFCIKVKNTITLTWFLLIKIKKKTEKAQVTLPSVCCIADWPGWREDNRLSLIQLFNQVFDELLPFQSIMPHLILILFHTWPWPLNHCRMIYISSVLIVCRIPTMGWNLGWAFNYGTQDFHGDEISCQGYLGKKTVPCRTWLDNCPYYLWWLKFQKRHPESSVKVCAREIYIQQHMRRVNLHSLPKKQKFIWVMGLTLWKCTISLTRSCEDNYF